MSAKSYPTVQTTWNIDGERSKILHYYFTMCEEAFVNWDLESIDVYLRSIKRIASGKLRRDPEWGTKPDKKSKKKSDEDTVLSKFFRLEALKRKYLSNPDSYMAKVKFYNKAEEIYEQINGLLQEHGFWFREGLDPSKAALRR